MDLTDIYRTLHPKQQDTFLLKCTGKLSIIDHILANKKRLSKFKKIEIVITSLSDQ